MNKLLLAAAILILPAAGCATSNGGTAAPRAQAVSANSQFCWKEKLDTQGDSLICNWQGSAYEACRSTNSSTLSRSALASGPTDAQRCANGQWLVQVTTK
jgi:hypothetical protein